MAGDDVEGKASASVINGYLGALAGGGMKSGCAYYHGSDGASIDGWSWDHVES